MSIETLSKVFFDYRGEIDRRFIEKIADMPIWDVKQCEVCKETIILPSGAPLYYHIDHYPQGRYISIIEKPLSLRYILNHFRIDRIYMVSQQEVALIRKILTS